jgi:hypothetical protein
MRLVLPTPPLRQVWKECSLQRSGALPSDYASHVCNGGAASGSQSSLTSRSIAHNLAPSDAIPSALSCSAAVKGRLPVVLYGLLAAAVFLVFRDYGVTWDETHEFTLRNKGPRTWAFWFHGFNTSDAPFTTGHNPLIHAVYFGVFKLLTTLGFDLPIHEVYHLLTGLVATVGVALTYVLARRLVSQNLALLAAIVIALTPRYLGHAFGNFKDIPFAVAWLACLLTLIRAVDRPSPQRVAWHGVAIGGLLICRIGGLLFIPVSLVGLLMVARSSRSPGWGPLIGRTAVAMALAIALHYLSYPYLLLHPIDGMAELFDTQREFGWTGHTLTFGSMLRTSDMLMWYVPAWLAVTLPEFTLLGLVLALAFALRGGRPGDQRKWSPCNPAGFLLCVSLVFPLLYVVGARAPVYDGIRHVLFVVAPLTIVAIVGWSGVAAQIPQLPRRIATVGVVTVMAYQAVALHPYQYVGFNALVGGTSGAQGKFTLDYWAATSKESSDWLAANGTHPRTLCVSTDIAASWERYLPEGWTVEGHQDVSLCPYWTHYVYGFSRNQHLQNVQSVMEADARGWDRVHTIERADAVLGEIWQTTRPVDRP